MTQFLYYDLAVRRLKKEVEQNRNRMVRKGKVKEEFHVNMFWKT